ncbi:MAG TPA: hypothetical protein VF605_07855 [Allosphingosinicella sp.]|jgi:hypothetical protein
MVRAALSVDGSNALPYRFVKHPKVGDRVGISRRGTDAMATIVGLRHERGPDGLGTLMVMARSAA